MTLTLADRIQLAQHTAIDDRDIQTDIRQRGTDVSVSIWHLPTNTYVSVTGRDLHTTRARARDALWRALQLDTYSR